MLWYYVFKFTMAIVKYLQAGGGGDHLFTFLSHVVTLMLLPAKNVTKSNISTPFNFSYSIPSINTVGNL